MRGGLGADPEIVRILEETRATFAQRILDALPDGIETPLVRAAVRGWIGFVEATALDWLAHRNIERPRLLALLTGLLVDAIGRAAIAV